MYVTVQGPVENEKIKVPKELEERVRSSCPKKEYDNQWDDIISDIMHSDEFYDKVIPQPIAKFIIEYNMASMTQGGYHIYDDMEIDDLVVVVIGYTRGNEAYTNMFAYKKELNKE